MPATRRLATTRSATSRCSMTTASRIPAGAAACSRRNRIGAEATYGRFPAMRRAPVGCSPARRRAPVGCSPARRSAAAVSVRSTCRKSACTTSTLAGTRGCSRRASAGSSSTASRRWARAARPSVSAPRPAPISTMRSSGAGSMTSTTFRTHAGSRKCWPSRRRGPECPRGAPRTTATRRRSPRPRSLRLRRSPPR